jgi:hypothetical protein
MQIVRQNNSSYAQCRVGRPPRFGGSPGTKLAALPSGHVGGYRTDDGTGWEAYVADHDALVLLGVYATKHAAVAAGVSYWKAKERAG